MKNYFEKLSAEHKLVQHTSEQKHFFRTIDDFLNADTDNKSQFPAVVMDSLEGRITGANEDGKTDMMSTGILFVKKLLHIDDTAAIDTAQAEMKALALSFAARMEHDAQLCENRSLKFLQEFMTVSIKYKYYGPIFDNCYGVLVSFQCGHIAEMEYKNDEWITI